MIFSRRNFLQGVMGLLAGLAGAETAEAVGGEGKAALSGGQPVPVSGPDLTKLPYAIEKGVKVFRLVAEPVKREFLPGRVFDVWGYNGSMPGPTIEVTEGDRVRIIFENRLPEPTTVHWHGIELPLEMDGVPAISQPLVMPGGSYTYEFTLHQNGTFFYHSHMAMQEMMGMIGLFIIHPRRAYHPRVDRDFGLILQEWAILPNSTIPNTLAMEFNWLTINGKAGPATTPLIVRLGDRVRIRMVNLGMDHHPMHIHGNTFFVTGTEAGRIPETAWQPQNTVLVGVAQARDIEFTAKYPGDWMLHCHLPHHMMNQMIPMVGPISHGEEGMAHAHPMPSEGKKRVPGFPQDMWMPMDEAVAKPETHGLPPGWSGAMTGMMTLVRVLPPDRYEEIMRLMKETPKKKETRGDMPHHGH